MEKTFFNLQDDERFCFFFAIQDKRQAIILAMSYIKYLQVFDSKSDLEYLFFIVLFKLF